MGRPKAENAYQRLGDHTPTIVLTREQDRRLRALAWKHVRRINAQIARRIWAEHRAKEMV